MAANGGVAVQQAVAPVLQAVETMQSSGDRAQKKEAHEYLDRFQKTVCLVAPTGHSCMLMSAG